MSSTTSAGLLALAFGLGAASAAAAAAAAVASSSPAPTHSKDSVGLARAVVGGDGDGDDLATLVGLAPKLAALPAVVGAATARIGGGSAASASVTQAELEAAAAAAGAGWTPREVRLVFRFARAGVPAAAAAGGEARVPLARLAELAPVAAAAVVRPGRQPQPQQPPPPPQQQQHNEYLKQLAATRPVAYEVLKSTYNFALGAVAGAIGATFVYPIGAPQL
ncbi:hypothetical protein HK405_008856 [Cladochytrium tenue]|nr:hypothetical protein HK405_008856 [Cladochytrium tenue]